jgi:hypothetical protein
MDEHIYIYMYTYDWLYIYGYIYIYGCISMYIHRERERERERDCKKLAFAIVEAVKYEIHQFRSLKTQVVMVFQF